MRIALERRGGVALRQQLSAQLELQILGGQLAPGQRLPSLRALARRLRIHHNTVAAAYQALARAGHIELRRASGAFVRPSGPASLPDARGLDEMIRLALEAAQRKGWSGAQIRSAVLHWLARAPPDRVLVVDPVPQMGGLLAHELAAGLGIPVASLGLDQLREDPSLAAGALLLALPYHADTLRRLAPTCSLETVALEVSEGDLAAIRQLPSQAILMVVSAAPSVLPFAAALVHSLRGDDVLVEVHVLGQARRWQRLVRAADLVFADALAAAAVRRSRPRLLREFRVLPAATLARAARFVAAAGLGPADAVGCQLGNGQPNLV